MIEAGLFLYDWLARRNRLDRSRRLDLRTAKEGAPLKNHLTTGFAYSDCRVDDARLVVLNAVDARERGADILHQNTLRFGEARARHVAGDAPRYARGGDNDRDRTRARQCGGTLGR